MSDPFVVNVEAAVVRDDEFLLIERAAAEDHAPGMLAFPGGTVEHGVGTDAIEATARRELREEVGVEVEAVEYACSRTFELDDGARCLDVVTRCPYASGDARPREPEEVAAVHWLSAEQAQARDDAPAHLLSDLERLDR